MVGDVGGSEGQLTLGGEVEGRGGAAGAVSPVDGALPVRVLVVVEHTVGVLAGVPVLAKRQLRHRGIHVFFCELTACMSKCSGLEYALIRMSISMLLYPGRFTTKQMLCIVTYASTFSCSNPVCPARVNLTAASFMLHAASYSMPKLTVQQELRDGKLHRGTHCSP